jgi:hypothetical protein
MISGYDSRARRPAVSGPVSGSWHHRSFGIKRSAEMGAAGRRGGGAGRSLICPELSGQLICG